MRGKLSAYVFALVSIGITPADAGKTKVINRCGQLPKDHPRGCGENDYPTTFQAQVTGSPPRMRGKLVDAVNANRGDRITPADAGKTI